MRRIKDLPAIGLGILLVGSVVAWFATGDWTENAVRQSTANNQASLIDQRLIQTAQQLAGLADSAEEQALVREVLTLTDHELDQAFATALREATLPRGPVSGPLRQLALRVAQIKARVNAGRERIAQLARDAAKSDDAAAQVELAKAELSLDEDELADAQGDLAKRGGDQHALLERALQEHEAAAHQLSQATKSASALGTATLSEQVRTWFALNSRNRLVLAAQEQARGFASGLEEQHNSIEKRIAVKNPASAASPPVDSTQTEDTSAAVARLQRLSDQTKTLTELDRRIQDCQQLADVYQKWSVLVEARRRSVVHLMLRLFSVILAILLAVVLVERVIRHAFSSQKTDRKRVHQLRIMAGIGVQLVGALAILLIIFGPPTQMTTIVGLATAGLTVVLKDFIVAFFGWFVLMGKNGIHLGDWVEIEGVGGEVIEIGVLKTTLLEMGNWTNSGHPTGRHVSFVNSFAIEGHYFNFSTTGQWLWDELMVMLPSAGDPYQMAEEIRQTVERETEADAQQAELDWERVTHQYGTKAFSAKPSVDLRPSVNRLDVNVRYITRAPQRYEVKSRLFQKVVEMLHRSASAGKPA